MHHPDPGYPGHTRVRHTLSTQRDEVNDQKRRADLAAHLGIWLPRRAQLRRSGAGLVANMTGNTVLFGLAIAQGDQLTILRSLTALLGFALGAMCSAFLVERNYERPRGTWTPRVVLALAIEACLLLIFALVWWLARYGPQVNLVIYLALFISHFATLAASWP